MSMSKEEYRTICKSLIPASRRVSLPDIPAGHQEREAVLIEFRPLPHLEFIIRNTIYKCGYDWSHTIFCGHNNYEFIQSICTLISKNIRVICLNVGHVSRNEYNNLLCVTYFWEKSIHGEHVLIYQEDSCLFKRDINTYLNFDYIGAPYGFIKNIKYVGNGGFSLRSRSCMLAVLRIQKLHKFKTPSHIIQPRDMQFCPEDVFYATNMRLHNIGRIAPWEIARRFATEAVPNLDATGGHQFWIGNPTWKQLVYNSYSFEKELK